MSDTNTPENQAKKAPPRRQKAYELLHLLCKMIEFQNEVKQKGPYGTNHFTFKDRVPYITEKDLKEKFGFDDELLAFFKFQLTKGPNDKEQQ